MRAGLARRTITRLVLALLILAGVYQVLATENLNDFQTFADAGRAVSAGEDPYALSAERATNLNPPLSLLFFRWLAPLEPRAAYRAWQALSALLFGLAFLWLARTPGMVLSGGRWLWALALAGLWYTLLMGQIYAALLLLCAGAWSLLERGRPVAAGVLIGLLAAIKPNLALWPLLLLASGAPLAALPALGVALALSLVPALVYGPGIYLGWLRALEACPADALTTNVSLPGLAARLGRPGLGIVLSAALAAGAIALALWRRPAPLQASALALPATLLASPIAWVGYTVLLAPILLSRRWTRALRAAAALLVVPAPLVYAARDLSMAGQALAGLVYFMAVVLVLCVVVWEGEGRERRA